MVSSSVCDADSACGFEILGGMEGGFLDRNVHWLLTLRFYWPRLLGICIPVFQFATIVFSSATPSRLILKSVLKYGGIERTAEWNFLLGALTLPRIDVDSYL